MNQESQKMAGMQGPPRSPAGSGQSLVGGSGDFAPLKLLGFQHLKELLVHVFLPILASFFKCITALLCVKETTTLTQQNLQKNSSTCTPRCLKQVRSAPCGRIEMGHVKQVT
jgi:hypothetical protein